MGAMQSAAAVALMPFKGWFFAAYTATVTHDAFQWAVNPKNWPFPLGDLDLHLVHGSLGPPEFTLQWASGLVQPF